MSFSVYRADLKFLNPEPNMRDALITQFYLDYSRIKLIIRQINTRL